MRQTNDFHHAIPPQAVNNDVPRASHPLLLRNEMTTQTESVNTDAGDFRHLPGAGPSGGFAPDRKHRPHQQVAGFGCFDAELAGALEQDAVDFGFSAFEKPAAQCPAASLAIRARRRAMAASWSAWLSSGVATVA